MIAGPPLASATSATCSGELSLARVVVEAAGYMKV
jgi:hypothetical protein